MKIREYVIKNFDTLETIVLLFFAAGFLTVLQEIKDANYFFGAAAVLMSILYWFRASDRTKNTDKTIDFKQKIIWYGLMITPIAIFAKIRLDERSNIFMAIAIGMLLIAFFERLHQKIAKKQEVPVSDFIRIIAAIIVALSIFALPLPNTN